MSVDVRIEGDSLYVNPRSRDVQPGEGLTSWLQRVFYLPTGFVARLFDEQRVIVGHHVGHKQDLMRPGQGFHLTGDIVVNPGVLSAPEWAPDIVSLFEDEHLLVVDKPSGLLIHGEAGRDPDTLDARVAAHYEKQGVQRRVLHAHRLDKCTSGLVLYAKHAYSGRTLDTLIRQKQVSRTYLALVHGRPIQATGTIDTAIGRDRHMAGRYRVHVGGKPAFTHYNTLGTARVGNQRWSLLKCRLDTGRTHQIRVHLASIGCPVVGDNLYGAGNESGTDPQLFGLPKWEGHALHAWRLEWYHPYAGRSMEVVSAPSGIFSQWLSFLKLAALVQKD